MLIPDHLLLFLEVSNDLRQRLLEDLNLILVCLDLSTLHLGSLLVLLFGAGINSDIALDFTVCLFLTLDLLLMLLKFVPLRDSLQGERLVFLVNLALNRLNSSLRLLLSFLLELLKLLFVLGLNLELHLSQLDLVLVLSLSDLLLKHRTVVLPLGEFELVKEGFFRDLRVRLILLFNFLDGDLTLLQLCIVLSPHLLNVRLHLLHPLI